MSIEKDLQDLATAVKELTAAIKGTKASVAANPAGKAEKPAGKAEKQEGEMDYETVREPFVALVKSHGRDVAIAAVKTVDESLKSLMDAKGKPELFPALLKAVQAAAKKPAPKDDA
jgi:hypothetical protein